jgi:hypothetical protein
MITEREKKALRIAKLAYQHFTHDALEIAKEIIALEREMAEEQDNPVTIPVSLPPAQMVKRSETVVVSATDIHLKPIAEVNSIRIAGPLNYARMLTESQPEKREYEEIPY